MTAIESNLVENVAVPPVVVNIRTHAVSITKMLSVIAAVIIGDICVYRADGAYAGWAVFLLAATVLVVVGIGRFDRRLMNYGIACMLVMSIARLVWQGNAAIVVAACFQLMALALAQHGRRPFIPELMAFLSCIIPAAFVELAAIIVGSLGLASSNDRGRWLTIGLPLAVCTAFLIPFVLANPDLINWLSVQFEFVSAKLTAWWSSLAASEVAFWMALSVISLGAISPRLLLDPFVALDTRQEPRETAQSVWYTPVRNTLWGVIGVFTMYLIFEFQSLWFREFPPNFYYSGYAHEGAAWLTCALGMTTVVLSMMFQGKLLNDPRVDHLRLLAWIWSALNLVLAISVVHRMMIYVSYNGMTRMRIVGLFGITCVVIGFVIVVWKIRQGRSFAWLIQYQLLALAIMASLLAVTPMDTLAYSYNVRQILAGNVAPTVQITEHTMSDDGWLAIWPLVDAPDEIIRNGVRAYLAERREQPVAASAKFGKLTRWLTIQISETRLNRKLKDNARLLDEFGRDVDRRRAAMKLFRETAYQWY